MYTASSTESPRVSGVPALNERSSCDTAKDLPSRAVRDPKKGVTFHKTVRVYPYLHYKNFSQRELFDSWYNAQEMDEIKAECLHTVQLVAHDTNVQHLGSNNNFWCFRGLEFRTSEGARRRQENRYLAWDAVMNEQETQYLMGEFSDEAIAFAYSKVSTSSQEAAYVLALEDAKIVLQDRFLVKSSTTRRRLKRSVSIRNIFLVPSSSRPCSTTAARTN